ncbi:hypothetical protein PENANT_c006G03542 [Penicillium antarcticum]|uniref:Inner kinetochore subunit AME1 domain-containing protein n=1 Tax=Penicillium antarcticum TaxID=416450 RepID=A0A1V6QD06_9EURO|nr:uncharacterized protein N7508_009199 [Penicillium antarcticum]KAJ5294378.1 hypothetical protein N7508_009199 [Penicillium antarcticum]OQD87089.1 hypothetical protein PENANT_c006G03542 [Penicillium antarcticum]
MEPTREERQQMRQRGAGTRKAKEVNFGFSFGGLASEPSATAPFPIVPEPRPQTQPATTPPLPKVSTQGEKENARTPGSARNRLPERPSTYDIPSDDGPEQTRSNKRRKINPIEGVQDTPTRRNRAQPTNSDSQAADNSAGGTERQPSNASPSTDVTTQAKPTTEPQPQISPIPEPSVDDQRPVTEPSSANRVEPVIPADKEQPAQNDTSANGATQAVVAEGTQKQTAPPKASSSKAQSGPMQPDKMKTPRERRHRSQSPINSSKQAQGDSRNKRGTTEPASPVVHFAEKSTTNLPSNVSTEPAGATDIADNGAEAAENIPETTGIASEQDTPVFTEPLQTTKKARGRPRKSTVSQLPETTTNTEQEHAPETQAEPTAVQAETSSKSKLRRGRPSLNGKTKVVEFERVSSESPPAQAEASTQPKRPRGRPSLIGKTRVAGGNRASPELVPDAVEVENPISKPQRGRPKKANREAEPEPEAEAEQPEADEPVETAVPKPQRGRPSKKGKRPAEPEPEPADPEPTTEDQPSPETVPTSKPRGRPAKKAKRPVEHGADSEADAEQEQPTAEPTEQPRRKTREPRGESFPVTVHRLANAVALGGRVAAATDSGDEQDSADELSSRQRTKVPNRGGVNPADVLGQICRESLEKTLNTLKDGIANEANVTRRAEWTRKKKVVEAFGLELENRLMDLSEMLDSNFVLGVQLKKAKKEMMELRSHLYRVKKEREHVALQMDAVRGKHIDEEKAKLSRTTINNSLHSLELALERNKSRTAAVETTSADLEFMLRTVADVSARAPGAQGGLLSQIRAFNAQLEATASRLER